MMNVYLRYNYDNVMISIMCKIKLTCKCICDGFYFGIPVVMNHAHLRAYFKPAQMIENSDKHHHIMNLEIEKRDWQIAILTNTMREPRGVSTVVMSVGVSHTQSSLVEHMLVRLAVMGRVQERESGWLLI